MLRHPLFRRDLLKGYLSQLPRAMTQGTQFAVERLSAWNSAVRKNSSLGEMNLEQAFNQLVFIDILGYSQPPGYQNYFTFLPKSFATAGEGFPDFLLGQFKLGEGGSLEKDVRLAVGELKGPGADLDRVDMSRLKTPVEQAFDYSVRNGLNVKWVIVSNMSELRLYHHSAIDHLEIWRLSDFVRDGSLTDEFWQFYYLLHRNYLIGWPEPSGLEKLLQSSLSARLRLTDDFYSYYREVVKDTFDSLAAKEPDLASGLEGRVELMRASQLLIHRGLVTCFFSDHPAELLPRGILAEVIDAARRRPAPSTEKIYEAVKDLFATINAGTPHGAELEVFGYNGGLFQPHPIVDRVRLDDALFVRSYRVGDDTAEGIFGFRRFDFFTDLNEHLLGRIFEETVRDLEAVHYEAPIEATADQRVLAHGKLGLFYTRENLTNHMAEKSLAAIFMDLKLRTQKELWKGQPPGSLTTSEEEAFYLTYLKRVVDIRIVDLACGSGAFLVSCFRELLREVSHVVEKLNGLRRGQVTLQDFHEIESDVLRTCIHGNDILSESVEIAKLSLWIASARKNMRLKGLETNFTTNDALASILDFREVTRGTDGYPKFDLVIGNPPWGGDVSEAAREFLRPHYPEIPVQDLDSYELFLLTGLKYLRQRGILAFVLPHTLLLPDHSTLRSYLLNNTTFVRYHSLGADWFGPKVRMNTTMLQLSNSPPASGSTFRSMTLVEGDRRRAIRGETNLSQLEESYSFEIPQERCRKSGQVELFRYGADDDIMSKMEGNSLPLGAVCSSGRGVELGKDGWVIQCPDCAEWDSPPRVLRGGKIASKTCNHCGHKYEAAQALAQDHVIHHAILSGDAPYVDGDSFTGRYKPLAYRGIRLGLSGINYKGADLYQDTKIVIRQAGVGLAAALDTTRAYCPQSIYVYRLRKSREDVFHAFETERPPGDWMDPSDLSEHVVRTLDHRFLLALFNSRIFHYYVFKRFGEIDAAQAFAKLTHVKIRTLPVPVALLTTRDGKLAYDLILETVDKMMANHRLDDDYAIERALESLFGLNAAERNYVRGQLGLVAYHRAMRELFPTGRPQAPERLVPVKVTV